MAYRESLTESRPVWTVVSWLIVAALIGLVAYAVFFQDPIIREFSEVGVPCANPEGGCL